MADRALAARNAFHGIAVPGRYGQAGDGGPAVRIMVPPTRAIWQIGARRGRTSEIAEAVHADTALALPEGPKFAVVDGLLLLGAAPDQWLVIANGDAASASLARLGAALSGLASLVDQSDGKAVLRLAGPMARNLLAKGCALDLHPRVFGPGDAATTQISLMPCHLWQLGDAPTYDLAVAASYAKSFWSWLTVSAAEYGYVVDA